MKYSTKVILLLLFIIASGLKCKKEDTVKTQQLPEETQRGKNTFGCMVNGAVWLPRANFPYSSLSTTIQYNILSLTASQGNVSILFISIRDLNIPSIMTGLAYPTVKLEKEIT